MGTVVISSNRAIVLDYDAHVLLRNVEPLRKAGVLLKPQLHLLSIVACCAFVASSLDS